MIVSGFWEESFSLMMSSLGNDEVKVFGKGTPESTGGKYNPNRLYILMELSKPEKIMGSSQQRDMNSCSVKEMYN